MTKDTYSGENTPPPRVEDYAFPKHLTDVQAQRLDEFRAALRDQPETKSNGVSEWSDAQLLRFMRARDFNVKKALKLMNDDLEWRKLQAGRRLEKSLIPTVFQFHLNGLVNYAGKDKDGRPIVILRNGRFFPRKVKDMMEIVNFFLLFVEGLSQYTMSLGFQEFTAIADMAGWSLSENFSLPVSQLLASMLQDHYPERLRYAFVVNNPFAFSVAWNLISPFLEERVKAKIHVWGSKTNKLKDYIDDDVLEQNFGGSKPEPYPIPDIFTEHVAKGGAMVVLPLGGLEKESPGAPKSDTSSPPPTVAAESKPSSGSISSPPAGKMQRQKSSGGGTRLLRIRQWLGREVKKDAAHFAHPEGEADPSDLKAPKALLRQDSAPPANRPIETLKKNKPRVALFGFTSRTGQKLVSSLLEDGRVNVTAFARIDSVIPAAFLKEHEGLDIVVGDLLNPIDVDRAIEGADVVISLMGITPSLQGGNEIESFPNAMRQIFDAMERMKDCRRLVLVSDAKCNSKLYELSTGFMDNAKRLMYWKGHYQYLNQIEEDLKARGSKGSIDYTIVRIGALDDAYAGSTKLIRMEENIDGVITRAVLASHLKDIVYECGKKGDQDRFGKAYTMAFQS